MKKQKNYFVKEQAEPDSNDIFAQIKERRESKAKVITVSLRKDKLKKEENAVEIF